MKTLSAEIALHEIGHNRRVVPDVCLLGVGGLGALLLVAVPESAANGFGPPNLAPGVEKVLASQNVIWGKLTEIILSGELAGEKGRGKADTALGCAVGRQFNICAGEVGGGVIRLTSERRGIHVLGLGGSRAEKNKQQSQNEANDHKGFCIKLHLLYM